MILISSILVTIALITILKIFCEDFRGEISNYKYQEARNIYHSNIEYLRKKGVFEKCNKLLKDILKDFEKKASEARSYEDITKVRLAIEPAFFELEKQALELATDIFNDEEMVLYKEGKHKDLHGLYVQYISGYTKSTYMDVIECVSHATLKKI